VTSPLGGDNRLVTGDHGPTAWSGLPRLDLPPVTAALAHSHGDALRAVWGHVNSDDELLIASAARIDEAERQDLRSSGFSIVDGGHVDPPSVLRAAEPGRLWLLTSGSTGRPKRVGHTLHSLTTVTGRQPPRRWLLPYSPGTYAWWQLVTLSLTQPSQDLVCVEPDEIDQWPQLAAREGVTAVSGTPTFWRQALWGSAPALRELGLEQVTLGGEPVDQTVLDALRETFPAARISWIYASSEAGASIAVHDGRAGFPQEWLGHHTPGRPLLKVDGEELVLQSPHHAEGLAGVIRTGDRVDVVDGRVHIVGRIAGDEINVGGSKISAAAVRDALQAHPDVAWASVKGRRAPIVGTIVTANVVVTREVTEAELVAHCQRRLPDYGIPRRFRFLDEIPFKETLKSDV
jgi:acyl-CoA synthetase (AMP-forming)/AMP-acid ligase II